MKKIIFTFAVLVSISLSDSAFAQNTNSGKIDEKATALTRDMSLKIGLNELEYIKLRALNKERLTKSREINFMYSNDINMRDRKMAELENNYDAELKAVLNSKQLESYATYKANPTNYTAMSSEE